MNDKPRVFDIHAARDAVQHDTDGVIGAFLDGNFDADGSLGDATWRSGSSEHFAIRWRFDGVHTGRIPGFGHTFIEATGNHVTVSGLTLVENRIPGQRVPDDLEELLNSGTLEFQRYVDWLAVFAQLGVLHLGRPMSIGDIRFVPPERGTTRIAGYNDQQEAD
jgi:hypothetical protein